MTTHTDHTKRSRTWIIGAVITALLGLFFAFDAIPKILGMSFAREATEGLGFSPDKTAVIGWVLLVCLVVFLIPRTAVLGALGLTAYLGGAVTVNLLTDKPLAGFVLSGVYVGVLVWIALILRRPELLRVLGLRGE
ncbi:DoxX family protein [Mycolicibacter kumamotonensis]|uniref:DoxX family protein n=1 Tax=Mycolicibacter kumamotonensis TaxID=354243 RepID=A0A7K3LF29_9MYCO|nr:DoxX family protein [Mycolicibacter kumamotonensis]NDJ90965.1 DoxX family protein [Mycolicibacter kumamotonensis]